MQYHAIAPNRNYARVTIGNAIPVIACVLLMDGVEVGVTKLQTSTTF